MPVPVQDSNGRTIGQMDLRFRSITRASDADAPADAIEEGAHAGMETGYIPVDRIAREMISPEFLSDVFVGDDGSDEYDFGEEATDYGFDPLDQLIAREAEGINIFAQQDEAKDEEDQIGRNNAFEFCDHTDHSVPTARDELLPVNGSRTFESSSRNRIPQSERKMSGVTARVTRSAIVDSHGKRFGAFEKLIALTKKSRNQTFCERQKITPKKNKRTTIRCARVRADMVVFDDELGPTYQFRGLVAEPRRSR